MLDVIERMDYGVLERRPRLGFLQALLEIGGAGMTDGRRVHADNRVEVLRGKATKRQAIHLLLIDGVHSAYPQMSGRGPVLELTLFPTTNQRNSPVPTSSSRPA